MGGAKGWGNDHCKREDNQGFKSSRGSGIREGGGLGRVSWK